jgi:hypothetical protein
MLEKKAILDPLDPKAVLSDPVASNHSFIPPFLDKGDTGVIGLQGLKGDTVTNHITSFS